MLDIKPLVFASFLIVLLSTGSTGNEIKGDEIDEYGYGEVEQLGPQVLDDIELLNRMKRSPQRFRGFGRIGRGSGGRRGGTGSGRGTGSRGGRRRSGLKRFGRRLAQGLGAVATLGSIGGGLSQLFGGSSDSAQDNDY